MQTDFMLLSRFVGAEAQSSPEARSLADSLIGAYRGAQLFAFLPYQLLMSISFVLFPMLARARAAGEDGEVARLVRGGVRLSLLITGLLCSCVSALAPHLLRFAFPASMAELGGPALRVLALGMGAFTLLGIVSSALTSLGRERLSAGLTALSVLLIGAGCLLLGSGSPLGPALLRSTALATSVGLAVGATLGALALRKLSGAFAPSSTLLRVGLAVALTCVLGSRLPWLGKPAVLLEALLVGLLYLTLLGVTREVGRTDLRALRALMGRRRPA
jgi:stage V sporulation protein B